MSLEGSLFIYSLSFSLLLALAPTLILFVMSFDSFLLDINLITETLIHYLPKDLIEPFVAFLIKKENFSYLTSIISAIVSLWLSSRSTYSFNLIVMKREDINYMKWMIRIKSIFQLIFIIMYVLLSVMLITRLSLIAFIYVPLLTSILSLIGFYGFYRSLTFIKRDISYGFSGALFSTLCLFISGILFFKILYQMSDVESIYGPLSSLIILFLSIYLMASIIYIGYIMNEIFSNENEIIKKSSSIIHILELVYGKVIMVFK